MRTSYEIESLRFNNLDSTVELSVKVREAQISFSSSILMEMINLNLIINQLQKNNPEIQRLQSSGQAGINAGDLIEELNRIANDLQRQSDQVVHVLRRGKEQQTVTQTPATRGNVPTQQQQVQAPPVQQQPVEI